MRRWFVGAAIVALLLVVAGCGGGGSSSSSTVEQEAIPSNIQARLAIEAQKQLRVRFHDGAVEVTDVTCERQYTGTSVCRLRVVDGHRRRGTVLLGIQVDRTTRQVRIGFAGASNRAWLKLLSTREAPAQEAATRRLEEERRRAEREAARRTTTTGRQRK
jgi:hypothetical protein